MSNRRLSQLVFFGTCYVKFPKNYRTFYKISRTFPQAFLWILWKTTVEKPLKFPPFVWDLMENPQVIHSFPCGFCEEIDFYIFPFFGIFHQFLVVFSKSYFLCSALVFSFFSFVTRTSFRNFSYRLPVFFFGRLPFLCVN